jgi:lipid A 3-O-deacylase
VRSRAGSGWRAKARPAGLGLLAALAAALCLHAPARAAEVVLSAGEFDVEKARDEGPLAAGVVVRLTGVEVWRSRQGMALVPAFGATVSEDDAIYGWAGGALLIPLSERWGLVPQLGAGVYEQGDGKNLGGSLEFRSGLALHYRASDAVTVGLDFSHLSNAGLHELNPGVNSLVLTFGVGRSRAFRSTPRAAQAAPARGGGGAARR